MIDILLILILLAIAAAIIFYLIREKKRGVTCVGCPHAKQCAAGKNAGKHTCGGNCSCGHTAKSE